jgi:hypothetical protein
LLAVTVRVTAVPGATVAEFAATVTTGLDAGAGLGPGDAGALPQAVVAERAMRAVKLREAGQMYRKGSFRISPTIQRNVRSGIGKLHDECGPKCARSNSLVPCQKTHKTAASLDAAFLDGGYTYSYRIESSYENL